MKPPLSEPRGESSSAKPRPSLFRVVWAACAIAGALIFLLDALLFLLCVGVLWIQGKWNLADA